MEQLAVIQGATLGWDDDHQSLTMRFSTYITEGKAAAQGIIGIGLAQAFAETKAPNVEWFNGRTCWVDVNEGTITYLRMFKRER